MKVLSITIILVGSRIEVYLEGSLISNIEKAASGHIKQLLIKVLTPIVKNIRNPPDLLEEYKAEYGYLGISLQSSVMKARLQPTPATTTVNVTMNPITSVGGPTITRTVTASNTIMQVKFYKANVRD